MMNMEIIKRKTVEINKYVHVSIAHRSDGLFDVAVKTNYFPPLTKWEIEESEVPAREGISSMQVYGYIEYEVKPAYLFEKI
jgi:hypothetical protein